MSGVLIPRLRGPLRALSRLGHGKPGRRTRMATVEDLVGEQLNAVTFVMDYVQFHFNGAILSALTNPILEHDKVRVRFPEPGSRDALCSLIETDVASVKVYAGDRIEVRMKQGHKLLIPLDPASYVGPEAATFVPREKGAAMTVW
jgi:hypothetical protein